MVLISFNCVTVYLVFVVIDSFTNAAQGNIKLCLKVQLPQNIGGLDNCTVACSPKFLNFDISSQNDEFALCKNNSSMFFSCDSNSDCRRLHMGATCKKVPCLCEGPFGNKVVYVLDPKTQLHIPTIDICTVSNKWISPDSPLVPFPWKTLLVVFGIVASFAICLIAVRWLSPFIRAMQAKTVARNHQNRRAEGDSTAFLSNVPLPERTRIRPCGRHSDRRLFDTSTSRNSNLSVDKPPPYELTIEGPPSYSEIEQEPLNPNAENQNTVENVPQLPRLSILQATSSISVTTI